MFQLTPVMRRATFKSTTHNVAEEFQLTPVMRRATWNVRGYDHWSEVSTHARHATGDRDILDKLKRKADVSTHARHATGDMATPATWIWPSLFQLTPVMRRATQANN